VTKKDILRRLILNELERMEPRVQSFEDNPIAFILNKYPTLDATLKMLMTSAYKDYISGIYIRAPKPTTFEIQLHNDQNFTLAFLGKAYEAVVAGKKFYLQTIGEQEGCIKAIQRLLMLGNPIQTKGPEGEEKSGSLEEPESGASESSPETETAEETES